MNRIKNRCQQLYRQMLMTIRTIPYDLKKFKSTYEKVQEYYILHCYHHIFLCIDVLVFCRR